MVASLCGGSRGAGRRHVSIPFIAGQWSLPLLKRLRHVLENDVSIPFIAGQWSLRADEPTLVRALQVSIPFIAGQWSLHLSGAAASRINSRFQSPSLRGSGRFMRSRLSSASATSCFNPLHCGAVVASSGLGTNSSPWHGFNPLHCGAVVASGGARRRRHARRMGFNPLHCGAVVASRDQVYWLLDYSLGFNPLHCGAVVASAFRSASPRSLITCFNPLHCGAVVASSCP